MSLPFDAIVITGCILLIIWVYNYGCKAFSKQEHQQKLVEIAAQEKADIKRMRAAKKLNNDGEHWKDA